MDGLQFDQLARDIAEGQSRRLLLKRLIKGVALALGAGVPGASLRRSSAAAAAVCRPGRQICRKNNDCCSGVCLPRDATGRRRCGCRAGTTPCGPNCCRPGELCVSGVCRKALGEHCDEDGDCVSDHCTDGVCCESTCDGQCESCNSSGECVPVTGAPVGDRPPCATDGTLCGGSCDGTTTAICAYPDGTTPCGVPPSCSGATATLATTCNGFGACTRPETVDCSPYLCGETTCLTSCAGPEHCTDGFCVAGACCPGQDYCGYGDLCCSSDRSSTASCCPANDGGCCECFLSADPGNEGPICCEPDRLCGVYPNDECCHYDEECFNDHCVWEQRLCEGIVCPNKCCGGECCGPWDTCGTDQDGNEACVPLPSCTAENQHVACVGVGICASAADVGEPSVCCPNERVIDLNDASVPPEMRYMCCPFGQQPTQGGDQYVCCPGPDYCSTSRGTSLRF